jgi:predicted TIM-barrel fold metal-dependent hydrolase
MTPPLITLEEHWYSAAVLDSFDNSMKEGIKRWPGAIERLLDAGEIRLREMNKGKVSLQVISHCAADNPSPEVCEAGNDQLANEIRKTEEASKRFAAFAVLPMAHPAAAATELERTVKEHGFLGALVDHKSKKGYCDGEEYDVLWKTAQDLDVPIYLHPSRPEDEIFRQVYAGNYSDRATAVIGGAMWGWHSEVGIHILRLHAAGVFDKFPKLKIIIGHFGEMIPFMLQRIIDQEVIMDQRERPFRKVWDENIWITTSGAWSLDPIRCILSNTKIEHILYSVDYPFTTNEAGLRWFEELEKSGLVTSEELELIAYKNAESLLGIKAP